MKKVEHFSTPVSYQHASLNKNSEWVNVANIKEISSAVFYFFLILFSILFFGLKGRQEYTIYNSVQRLFKNVKPFRNYYNFDFELLPFNSKNRFIKFYLYFYRDTTNRIDSNISFKYLIKLLYPNITERNIWHSIDINFHFENGQLWTEEYPLYVDYMFDFKSISIHLKVEQNNFSIYKGLEFGTLFCSTESTQFNVYFNLMMTILLILALFELSYLKYSNQIKSFKLNQILLFPLIIVMILSNNPLYFYHLIHPTQFYYYMMIFFVPTCDAFIYFTIIFMMFYSMLFEGKEFDRLAQINNSKQKVVKFSIITFTLSVIYTFVMVVFNYYITNNSILVNFPTLIEYQNNLKIEKYKSCANAISVFIVLILLLASFLISDEITTSSVIYIIIFLPIFIEEFCFNGIFIFFDLISKRNDAEITMSKMIIQNLFCIFLVYIHWPFDIREKYEQFDENSNDENETFAEAINV